MPNLAMRDSWPPRWPRTLIFSTGTPSTRTSPASGSKRPMAIFSVTDLPWPEPPMITSDRPAATSRDHSV